MVQEGTHPAEAFEADVRVVSSRAKLAMGALALTALNRLLLVPILLWQSSLLSAIQAGNTPPMATLETSDTLVRIGSVVQLGLLLVTAVLFLRWIHRLVKATRALGGDTLRWKPSEAVWSFIIPIISVTRPFHVLRDVHDHLAPEAAPEPVAQVVASESSGYRSVEMKEPPPAEKVPHASIGAWWGFFWLGNVFSNIASRQTGTSTSALVLGNGLNAVADAIEVVSAILAIVVVRGVTSRLVERYRRVRHASVETLATAGITLGDPLG